MGVLLEGGVVERVVEGVQERRSVEKGNEREC